MLAQTIASEGGDLRRERERHGREMAHRPGAARAGGGSSARMRMSEVRVARPLDRGRALRNRQAREGELGRKKKGNFHIICLGGVKWSFPQQLNRC